MARTHNSIRQAFVRWLYPAAVCEKKPGHATLYQVKKHPGGPIIAGAFSAVAAWRHAATKLLEGKLKHEPRTRRRKSARR